MEGTPTPMTPRDKAYILFNNRSQALVEGFLRLSLEDARELVSIESKLAWLSSQYNSGRTLEINAGDVLDDAPDPRYGPEDLAAATGAVLDAHDALMAGGGEYDWLRKRGLTDDEMRRYKLGALSAVSDECMEVIGASCHPALTELLNPERGPGITIPLIRDGVLVNCTTRRIDDLGKLKYTQAVPELDVWGLDTVHQGAVVHVVEGLFDMIAMHRLGLCAVSSSTAMWSGPQILKLLRATKDCGGFAVVADDDQPGLRSAKVMSRLLSMYGRPNTTYRCERGKDPAEMIMELGGGAFLHVDITRDMIASAADTSFNFTDYLKKREF